jgi:hypothetical protein
MGRGEARPTDTAAGANGETEHTGPRVRAASYRECPEHVADSPGYRAGTGDKNTLLA